MKKILVQRVNDNKIFWGAASLNNSDDNILKDYPNNLNNSPITFKEVEVEAIADDFSEAFCHERVRLVGQLGILYDKTRSHIMNVGQINPRKNVSKNMSNETFPLSASAVELIPNDEMLDGFVFCLSYSYYYDEEHEWKRLATSDKVSVVVSSIVGNVVFCKIHQVISSNQKQLVEAHTKSNRLQQDLSSMAGHVMLSAKVSNVYESQNEKTGLTHVNIKLELNQILLYPDVDKFWIPTDILGDNLEEGTSYNVWVGHATSDDLKKHDRAYDLWITQTSKKKVEKQYPINRPEQELTSIVGTICSYNKGKHLLWVNFDNDQWSTCVFRNNIVRESWRSSKSKYIDDRNDISIWGPIVKDYLPLGFPATFYLDLPYGGTNSRLFLLGFNPGNLEGRVSSRSEAIDVSNRILQSKVMCSPYSLRNNGIMLTSEGYAGFAASEHIPIALLDYCRQGIFSTEMKVPARVEIRAHKVIFNVNVCLEEERLRMSKGIGSTELMKVCSIYLGKVYLTSEGGYPIEYICKNEGEEYEIRRHMFERKNFTIINVDSSGVSVDMGLGFDKIIENLNIPIGGLFIPDKKNDVSSKYNVRKVRGIDCLIVEESLRNDKKLSNQQSPLMLVGIDFVNKNLLAVANHEHLHEPFKNETYVETIRQLLPDLWLCKKDGRLLLMKSSKTQSALLKHLEKLYGGNLPVQVGQYEDDGKEGQTVFCVWRGIACGSDYRSLFSGRDIKLQVPLSKRMPRVLFFDAVLTAPVNILEEGTMEKVQLTGEVTKDGALVCKSGNLTQSDSSVTYEDSKESQNVGVVKEASANEIVLIIGNEEVIMNCEEQLHIPIADYAPIEDIFTKNSEWAVLKSDNGYQLDNSCPEYLVPYTLQKERRRGKIFQRRRREWIVKSEYGQIAVSEVDNGVKGDVLLMIHEKSNGYINYVTESDELLLGQEVSMILQDVDIEKGVMKCTSVDKLTMTDSFEIPIDRWSWNGLNSSFKNIEPIVNCAFRAKIIEWREADDVTILDRRCLIPQCELFMENPLVEGYYQMRVSGFNSKGYRLTQNNVTVTLPWEEASFSKIPDDEIFKSEFFRIGTLVIVYLKEEAGKPVALWRSYMNEKFDQWLKEAKDKNQKDKMMRIHHIGTSYIFLEYDHVILYANAAQLGKWEGDDLKKYYIPGQILDGLLKWEENSKSFSVCFDSKEKEQIDLPNVGDVYRAKITKYLSNGDCYVKFGGNYEWYARIRYWDLTWIPYPVNGEKPYPVGECVNIKIKEVNLLSKIIIGSVRECLERPLHGLASIDANQNPELQFFTYKQTKNDYLILQNLEGVEAEINATQSFLPLKELKTRMQENNGLWLPAIGINETKNRIVCSQVAQVEAFQRLQSIKEGYRIRCSIIAIQGDKRLIVSHGLVIGRIPRIEATGQALVSLSELYHINQEIECVITSFDSNQHQFLASIMKKHADGLADIIPNMKVGCRCKVKVLSADPRGALVQLHDSVYKGIIPVEEISHEENVNMEVWAKKFIGDVLTVECIVFDSKKGIINFSRKNVIIPGTE